LIRANTHKAVTRFPNGYETFKELHVGEELVLPDKWFDGTLDRMPKSYFAALPHPDGITPGKGTLSGPPYSASLVAVAQQADATLDAEDAAGIDYCVSVTRPGSAVNSAVHAFKVAWNAEQSPPVPINTGNYELPTADAMKAALGGRLVWDPCPVRTSTPTRPQPATQPVRIAPKSERISAGQVVGVALVGAGVVAGAIYLVTK
jgi:hypothetical protein